MSIVIDCSAALVATPRARVSLDLVLGARLLADDAQPRLENRSMMPTAVPAWRLSTGSTTRGLELAIQQGTKAGRAVIEGAAYVTTTKQHFSTRSGPPTSRPPA